ncbi:pyridoxal phosphate-dependent aminotransferase [Anaerovorax odorimutans]|uniref:pyridoxal phosphate-dependent aminotransferase n=1 Tax=Anaerovorax odorimutans TaxID=109327 RepID=UPI0004167CBB|nr:aminotransferase class I/II-fold pyridoxal phosphate-dependent enzyme [Anaerovorax odorimutans]
MANYKMAEANSRIIPLEDKIFGINKLAKEMIAKEGADKVVNSTIGSLLDDNGNLVVLSSVVDVLKDLTPTDYADYAPIAGTPDYQRDIKKAAFGKFQPKCYTEAIATPGGTGSIRNTIQNYSKRGDQVLTSDWYWSPYSTIAQEIERTIATYTLFDDKGNFNISSFDNKVNELLSKQDGLVIIINTPAHNPTGYTFTDDDWDKALESIKNATKNGNKKVTLLVDVAYIDFAGDADKYRSFYPKLENLPTNILVIIGFSMSKGYTMYGMRSGAMICMTSDKEIADEFKTVCSFSCRGSWSNCTRASMVVLSKIFADKALLDKVTAEREKYCQMLVKRGKTFQASADEVGLNTVPFDSGFFIVVPCENAEEVGKELQKSGIFTVPIGKGLRVSVASVSEAKCKMLPAKMLEAINKVNA